VDERAHLALVVLVRPEDVEILEPGDAGQPALALGVKVELLLRIPVEIEGMEPRQVLVPVVHAAGAVAIGGR